MLPQALTVFTIVPQKAFLTGKINTGTQFDSTDLRSTIPRLSQSANNLTADNPHGIQSAFSIIKGK
jgi:hypothetical protein